MLWQNFCKSGNFAFCEQFFISSTIIAPQRCYLFEFPSSLTQVLNLCLYFFDVSVIDVIQAWALTGSASESIYSAISNSWVLKLVVYLHRLDKILVNKQVREDSISSFFLNVNIFSCSSASRGHPEWLVRSLFVHFIIFLLTILMLEKDYFCCIILALY